MKTQPSPGRTLLALVLAGVILCGYRLIPNSAESIREMRRFTHTPRGGAILVGIVILFTGFSKLVFVDLWYWLEMRRRRKGTRSSG